MQPNQKKTKTRRKTGRSLALDVAICSKCGGAGHLVCRPNIYTLVGELYTVDCEDCFNSTNEEHEDEAKAVEQWNTENAICANTQGDTPKGRSPGGCV